MHRGERSLDQHTLASKTMIDFNTSANKKYGAANDFVIDWDWGQSTAKRKIDLGEGNNFLLGFGDNKEIKSGSGDDFIYLIGGDQTVESSGGNNIIYTSYGDDKVLLGDGDDYVNSGSGDDLISTSGGNDVIVSGDGVDTIFTGSGNDVVFAGEGDDYVVVGIGTNVVHGGNGDDVITGGKVAGKNYFFGEAGDDTLRGGSANDVLNGGSGDDYLEGRGGSNKYVGGSGADTFALSQYGYHEVMDFNTGEGDKLVIGQEGLNIDWDGFDACAYESSGGVQMMMYGYRDSGSSFHALVNSSTMSLQEMQAIADDANSKYG